jgi:predicted enzyme related to lactoylglutathione lyase
LCIPVFGTINLVNLANFLFTMKRVESGLREHSSQEKVEESSVTIYFEHEQLDELVINLTTDGFVFIQQPTDHSYLWREAVLCDPAGNRIKLFWAGEARKNPPWRVEKRV